MNKNIGIIIGAGIVLSLLLMNIQIPIDGKKTINGTVVEKLDSNTVIKDDKFLQWAEIVGKTMKAHISDVVNATSVDNYSAIEEQGKVIVQDAETFLNQSANFQISPGLNSTLEDIRLSLEDYKTAGKYLDNGGKDRDSNSLMTAAEYAEQAYDHMQNASIKAQYYRRNR